MKYARMLILMVIATALAISGCTMPDQAPSPTPSPTVETPTPTALPADIPTPTPLPSITATPTPAPEPSPVAGKMFEIKDLEIYWDTVDPLQYEKATFTLDYINESQTLTDVRVAYRVITPVIIVNYDGTNTTTILQKESVATLGMMKPGDEKKVEIEGPKHQKVPTRVEILVTWNGGSEQAFNTTLEVPDMQFGTIEY